MARKYIHELSDWPHFTWDSKALSALLSGVRLRQGLLVGKMQGFGLTSQWTATLKVLTDETIKSSAIEGVVLNPENVRSSLARRLGLDVGGLTTHKDRYVDGVVEMMLDATQKFDKPLTKERLYSRRNACLTGTHIYFREYAQLPTNFASAHGGMTVRVRCKLCQVQSVAIRFITSPLRLLAWGARWESF
jgi:hypothetical protein